MRKADIIVIGGGIAGLSAAARFANHGETLVLEREAAPGFHSSGRSATFCHFGIGGGLVHRLTALSRETFAAAPEAETALARRMAAFFIARADELAKLDALETVTRAHSPEARRIEGEELRDIVPVLRIGEDGFAAGLFDPDAYKLDSDAMLQANIQLLRAHGGEIVNDAPVGTIRYEGGRWIVDTPGERYSAPLLVNAAGSWADAIAAMAGVAPLGLVPLRRTIVAFDAPEGIDVSGWPFTKTIAPDGFYFLPEGSGRLLASPMDETVSDPCDAQPDEIDIATAAWRVEQGTTMEIGHIAHKWAGLRTFAPDHCPVVGFAPDAPGFLWLAGQGGFGLQTSPAMAMAAEALLLDLEWPDALSAYGVGLDELAPERFARG